MVKKIAALSIEPKMNSAEITRETGKAVKSLLEFGDAAEKANKSVQKLNAAKQQSQGQLGPQAQKMQESSITNQMQQNQNKITDELKHRKEVNKQLKETQKQLENIGKSNGYAVQTEKEQVELLEKKNNLIEQESRLRSTRQKSYQRTDQMQKTQDQLSNQNKLQSAPGGQQDPESDGKMSKSSKMLISAIAGIGTTIATTLKVYDQVVTQQVRTTGREGSMAAGAGQELSGIYDQSGQGWESLYYSPEKHSALRKAAEFLPGKRARVNATTAAVVSGSALAAGAAGAVFGGFPAIPSAIAGGAAGMANRLLDEESRLAMGDKEGFDIYQAQKLIKSYRETEESEKKKNFVKTKQEKAYNKFQIQNQRVRRSLGYGEEDFKNNLLVGAGDLYKEQFSKNELLGSAGEVLSAGGSTNAARDAIIGDYAGYSRNMRQQNASSVIGGISKTLDSGDKSNNAYRAILEEGMRNGLNTSDLNRNMEHYTQTMSDYIIGDKGLTDKDSIADFASQIKISNTSKEGIEGSLNAFKRLSQMSGDMFTNISSMQHMRKIKGWDKLGGHMQNALGSMDLEDMNMNSEVIKSAASAAGRGNDIKGFTKELRGSKIEGLKTRLMANEEFDDLEEFQGQYKDLPIQKILDLYRQKRPEMASSLQGKMSNFMDGYGDMKPYEQAGVMDQLTNRQFSQKELEKRAENRKKMFEEKDTGVAALSGKGLGKEFTSSIGQVSDKTIGDIKKSKEAFADMSDKDVSNFGNFKAIMESFGPDGKADQAIVNWIKGLDTMASKMAKLGGQDIADKTDLVQESFHDTKEMLRGLAGPVPQWVKDLKAKE